MNEDYKFTNYSFSLKEEHVKTTEQALLSNIAHQLEKMNRVLDILTRAILGLKK